VAQQVHVRQVLEAHREAVAELEADAIAKQAARRHQRIAGRAEEVVRGVQAPHAAVVHVQHAQRRLAVHRGAAPLREVAGGSNDLLGRGGGNGGDADAQHVAIVFRRASANNGQATHWARAKDDRRAASRHEHVLANA
jgi:hypothetical protein